MQHQVVGPEGMTIVAKVAIRTLKHADFLWVNREDLVEWIEAQIAATADKDTREMLTLFRDQAAKLL